MMERWKDGWIARQGKKESVFFRIGWVGLGKFRAITGKRV
jgi:hypothetical protein